MRKAKNPFYLFVIVILLIQPLRSLAATPIEDLKDKALLESAASDIRSMGKEEIESFLSYSAACEAYPSSETGDAICKKEERLYFMKYGAGRAVDRISYASDLISAAPTDIERTNIGASETAAQKDLLPRLLIVKAKIYSETRGRFKRLSLQQQP